MSNRQLEVSEQASCLRVAFLLAILAPPHATAFAAERANPFTGTSASYEQKLRLLDERKLDAAIANEELAAEKANQERMRLRSGRFHGTPNELEPRRALVAPAQPAMATPLNVQIVSKAPRLVGVVSTPSGWMALVEAEGRVTSVREGQSVGGVKVTAIGRDTATLNGKSTQLQPVVGRIDAPTAMIKVAPASAPAPVPADVIDLMPGGRK